MSVSEPPTDEILAFRKRHGLDPYPEKHRIWLAQLGGLIVPLPNFRWRRAIIAAHDSHHLLTGYEPTLEGELAVAAWEVGARSYTDPRARLLCIVLAMLGLMVCRRATIAAFRAGRSRGELQSALRRDFQNASAAAGSSGLAK